MAMRIDGYRRTLYVVGFVGLLVLDPLGTLILLQITSRLIQGLLVGLLILCNMFVLLFITYAPTRLGVLGDNFVVVRVRWSRKPQVQTIPLSEVRSAELTRGMAGIAHLAITMKTGRRVRIGFLDGTLASELASAFNPARVPVS